MTAAKFAANLITMQTAKERRLRWAREELFPGQTLEDVSRSFKAYMEQRQRFGCSASSLARYERSEPVNPGTAMNTLRDLTDYYVAEAIAQGYQGKDFCFSALCPDLSNQPYTGGPA